MARPACVDDAMGPSASLELAASAEAEFQQCLKEHLCTLHDTISSKCGDLVRKFGEEREQHLQGARAAERERLALQQEVDRLTLVLKGVGDVPPAGTPSTAVDGDDLRNSLTLKPWLAPAGPPDMLPLPGQIVDDAASVLNAMPTCLPETEMPAPEQFTPDRVAALVAQGEECCHKQLCECRAPEQLSDVVVTGEPVPLASGESVAQADSSQAMQSDRKQGRSRVEAVGELKNDEEADERSAVVATMSRDSYCSASKDAVTPPSAVLLRRNTSRSVGFESNDEPSTRMQAFRDGVTRLAFHNAFVKGFSKSPPPVEGCLAGIVGSRGFELLCSCAITLNAVFIALASNHAMKNLHKPSTSLMDIAELLFCLFYTVELSLRFLVHKQYYIYSSEWAWNSFDLLLVVVSLQETMVNFLPIKSAGISLSFLRILRVMKMVRLFRVVRLMRMFRELRLIWNSIFGCVKAIFWAMMLIVSVSFMLGVCFVQASTAYLEENYDAIALEELQLIKDSWGSVQTAMLTLYKSVTGGQDWAEFASTLWPVGAAYYMLFLLYILFYTCVICNTITSLFVESTMVNADKDQQVVIQSALENSDEYIEKLRGWFSSVDSDGNGCITYDEFSEKLQDPEAIAFASTLNIELTDLKQFFAGLSNNGTRAVNLEAFVVGCIRMRGPAKSMDLLELMFHQREAAEASRRQLSEFEDFCRAELKSLRCSWERSLSEEGKS
eukprot:TRINITY_DN6497_c0_g1_i4.p1 TRINITY_DN6497_c0_g1~~TRINITY_DN6497_c0_g1_i4.p1  ORF type:complete len:723 (-),score=151.68 TRINITY_DN6497_c0_g1_i4:212-2380(-)